MILTYRGCPQQPGTRWHHELAQMEVGRQYEVAEIFEMEGYVMARPPEAKRWPVPGTPAFGIQPEWFDATNEPLPIVSCGFYYNDFLRNFYGVVLEDPREVEAIAHLKGVEPPDDEENFDDWQARELDDASPAVARALYQLMLLPVATDFGVFRHVHLAEEVSRDTFAYAGAFLDALARFDVTRHDYSEALGRLLNALEIPSFEVSEIDTAFWQGTRGGKRLINAKADGTFIYGTENPPNFMLDEGERPLAEPHGD